MIVFTGPRSRELRILPYGHCWTLVERLASGRDIIHGYYTTQPSAEAALRRIASTRTVKGCWQ